MANEFDAILASNPCYEGATWLKGQTAAGLSPAEAWLTCERGDWMLWALCRLGMLTDEQRLFWQVEMLNTPIAGGRVVRDLLTDPRSIAFVELKERRLAGEYISEQEWKTASFAASFAAGFAATVADDADDAAAVAVAVAAAAADVADATAATAATRMWQANRIRQVMGNPFK